MHSKHTSTVVSRVGLGAYQASLLSIVCLPFLVPFSDARNIDLQGLILILAGLTGIGAVMLRKPRVLNSLSRLEQMLLGVFVASCMLSLLANPHKGYDLLGAPYIRLGAAGLVACVACGLALRNISSKRLMQYLYLIIGVSAILSIPYNMLRLHTLVRIGGVFAQADIFAVFLGCGLLLGLAMWTMYPRWRPPLLIMQLVLLGLLLLTETRAVLFLVIILYGYMFWQNHKQTGWSWWQWLACIIGALLVLIGAKILLPVRVTSGAYADQSIRYRLVLQAEALRPAAQKPLFGYGPGNLADALACNKLLTTDLQQTCHKGYFFNSSHNIFLDRILAIGWLGGLAFLALVLIELRAGLWSSADSRVLAYCTLLIAGYYLSNVTDITLELLLWILLLHRATRRNNKYSVMDVVEEVRA